MDKFYSDRDGKAKIKLCLSTKENPFEFINLKVEDFGVSDNIYVCELPDGYEIVKKELKC